jgi:PKD repeat protein
MKHLIFIVFFSLSSFVSFSQCHNADFELGNFSGWVARSGTCCPINLPNVGIIAGRHTITSGSGTDPRTCNSVPVVCPWGGAFSARLGNPQRGSRADGLEYTFVPTPSSALFTYSYAVVFEEPGHTDDEQPRFETKVIANGTTIPCTQYEVSASSNLLGFETCTGIDWQGNPIDIIYRNWSTVGVDLTPYIGQSVTIQFSVGDCSLGRHFGYAYIDAISCQPMELEVLYCIEDTSATLTAPEGFAFYQWSTGDITPSITIDPQEYDEITCIITSFSGCVATLTTFINPADPQPSFSADNACFCEDSSIEFINQSTSVHSPIIEWQWSFGDGITSSLQSPTHIYESPGTYTVSLLITTELGCAGQISATVDLYPCPTISSISHN